MTTRCWPTLAIALLLIAAAPCVRTLRAQDTTRTKPDTARLPMMTVREARIRSEMERRLERAKALGGRIIPAKTIRAAAPTSRTLGDLMRRTAGASVQVVAGYGSATCLLVQRNANLRQQQTCALLVVDDVPSAGDAFLAPTDVDLIVVVPPTAATARFGEAGRYGAVVVYTRMGWRDSLPN